MFLFEISCFDKKANVFRKSVVSENEKITPVLVGAMMDTIDTKKVSFDRVEIKSLGEVSSI